MSKTVRKAAPRTRPAKKPTAPDQPPKYAFVVAGKVVATAETTLEAIQAAKAHRSAVIYELSYYKNLAELKKRRRVELADKRVKRNLVAEFLCDESNGLAQQLEEEIEKVVPDFSLGCTLNSGTVYIGEPGNLERRATNRECADWRDDLTIGFCFDLRKDLCKQLGNWLTTISGKLAIAAEKVKVFGDYRNKSILRRLVAEDGLAERIEAEGKCIGFGGKIVTKEQFELELKDFANQQTGGDL